MKTPSTLSVLIFGAFLFFTPLAGQKLNRDLEEQTDAWLGQQVTALVARIKETERGRIFLENHSEADLRKLILFLQEPSRRFESIQDIPDPCSYFWAVQEYFFSARKEALETRLRDFLGFISEDFQIADRQNISMLTHFLMTCHSGIICEALADRYTRLFGSDPGPFLEDLEGRENWKDIVRQLEGGDWQKLKMGLSKLGSSAFECELKAFVASLEKRFQFSAGL
jgi:hypothetical protein